MLLRGRRTIKVMTTVAGSAFKLLGSLQRRYLLGFPPLCVFPVVSCRFPYHEVFLPQDFDGGLQRLLNK